MVRSGMEIRENGILEVQQEEYLEKSTLLRMPNIVENQMKTEN